MPFTAAVVDQLIHGRKLAWRDRFPPLIRPFTWASWSVVEQGILFAGPSGKSKPALNLFDFAKHRVRTVEDLDVVPFWLGATRDGKTVVFDQPGWQQAQIMLSENFRKPKSALWRRSNPCGIGRLQ